MNNHIKTISIDRLLSTWIVFYAYLYIFGITRLFNPIILLYIAYSFAILASILIIYEGDIRSLLVFMSINTVLKVIPIMLVWNKPITTNDITFSFVFVMIYIVYMNIIQDDIICVYKDMVLYYINNSKGRETDVSRFVKQIMA